MERCAPGLWSAQDAVQPVRALEPDGGAFNRIFAELAGQAGVPERLMIDATHLKAHRTAASLLKKGMFPAVSGARKAA
jgi:hypothetical protein